MDNWQKDCEWLDWIQHDGSKCPIPDVKKGDYQVKFIINTNAQTPDCNAIDFGEHWERIITAYRIKQKIAPITLADFSFMPRARGQE